MGFYFVNDGAVDTAVSVPEDESQGYFAWSVLAFWPGVETGGRAPNISAGVASVDAHRIIDPTGGALEATYALSLRMTDIEVPNGPVNDGATVDATANGDLLTCGLSLLPGSASGEVNATASGAVLTCGLSLVPGVASGQRSATASGAVLTCGLSLVPGVATGQINATASGAVLTCGLSLVPGVATGQVSATANGALLTCGLSLVPGVATGQRSATASGAVLTCGLSLLPGVASGLLQPIQSVSSLVRAPQAPGAAVLAPRPVAALCRGSAVGAAVRKPQTDAMVRAVPPIQSQLRRA